MVVELLRLWEKDYQKPMPEIRTFMVPLIVLVVICTGLYLNSCGQQTAKPLEANV